MIRQQTESPAGAPAQWDALRPAFEHAAIGMALLDPGRRFLRVNAAMAALAGRSAGDLEGEPWASVAHHGDTDPDEALRRADAAPSRGTDPAEMRILRPDGSTAFGLLTVCAIAGAGGTTESYLCQLVDITERRRAEEESALLRRVAVALAGTDGVAAAFAAALAKVCQATGWLAAEAWMPNEGGTALERAAFWTRDGVAVAPFIDAGARLTLQRDVGLPGATWARGRSIWTENLLLDEYAARRAEAKVAGFRGAFSVPVYGEEEIAAILTFYMGTPTKEDERFAGVVTGVAAQLGALLRGAAARSALKQAYEVEHEAADRLRTLDGMKNAFLEGVSHDLRTPLSAILGTAVTLEQRHAVLTGPEIAELTRAIARQARRLERLLGGLLDLNRLAHGVAEPIRSPVKIAALVEQVVGDLDITGRLVVVDVEDFTPVVDAVQTERILENLLVNAVRHTPAGTPVWVRGRDAGGALVLLVEDAGPGVPDRLKRRIFEPFVRGDESAASPGSGIGLSLVSRFAALHGGAAWVEDRPGGGATFVVRLAVGPPTTMLPARD